uniref:ARAD1C26884p n=1 Tax=Blastobotrys adeninivorans TaxID=409370 RepID=A0A060T279_BLAAD
MAIMSSDKTAASVARTKTFTGCWTCRARKIKCDLTRPTCLRCAKANLKCEGYTIKLRWSSGNGGEIEDDSFQRRNVDFVEYPPDMVYETYDDMDDNLAKLHTPTFSHENQTVSLGPFGVFEGIKKRKNQSPAGNSRTKKRGRKTRNGVATSLVDSANTSTAPSPSTNTNASSTNYQQNPVHTPAGESDPGATTSTVMHQFGDPAFLPLELPNIGDPLGLYSKEPLGDDMTNYQILHDELTSLLAGDSAFDLDIGGGDSLTRPSSVNLETALPTPNSSATSPARVAATSSSDTADSFNESHYNNAITITPNGHGPMVAPMHDHHHRSNNQQQDQPFQSSLFGSIPTASIVSVPYFDAGFGLPTNTLYFNPQARFLLDHYINHVCEIMMVVRHSQNPWKSIYLPRAICAIGELVSVGHTASSKNALLHALMSVSACHLQSKYPENSYQRRHYYNLSQQLKSEAYKWFSECLMKNFARQKYKDIMAAVLSMVSIDVVAGSATDCKVHLAACKSIVNMRCKLRPKISMKAAILHRIAGFLSLLQGSTDLAPTDLKMIDSSKEFNDQWLDVRFEDLDIVGQHHDISSLASMNEESEFEEYWMKIKEFEPATLSDDFYDKELVSTVTLYGVPDSLILLFCRMSKLTKQVLMYRYSGESLPRDLVKQCGDLESALVSWQSRYDLSKHSNLKGELRLVAMYHIAAFHHAMIIYYYRLVRDINPAILQSHIATVFDNLEQIQVLNSETTICVPLMFPAFVAACEITADRQDLRNRYNAWLDQLMVTGLGNYDSVRQLVPEVWRRRDAGEPNSEWWKVMVELKMTIMLG